MDWIADVGSVIAAVGAAGAAIAATVLVRKTQAQVETGQKQTELAQLEFFAGNRPIVIPTGLLDLEQVINGPKSVDLTSTQMVRIRNIGPGVALNLSVVLFGPPPDPPSGLLPNPGNTDQQHRLT